MNTNHAPGPWVRRLQKTAIGIFDACGQLIATVTPGRFSKTADAMLIAAAPDLLAALKDAKANAGNPERVYQITSAAVAKAEGRTP